MSQQSTWLRPSEKIINTGLAFLAISIVIGIAGGADTYSAVTGIIMFVVARDRVLLRCLEAQSPRHVVQIGNGLIQTI